jgi:succinate dehydrogenase / fumarate reductase flavoprotein subunit
VARCIVREIKEGRGSPHGGVYLDIAWIKKRMPNAAEHIKRKLPSMYHQFKELADVDITSQAMEVGPTTHYMMGGVKVDGDTQSSTLPGLYAAGECAAGLHGANRLGGNSLSDLLVFGQRAGQYAAEFARSHGAPSFDEFQVETATRRALAPFERGSAGENPFAVQHDLQETMQDLVGIVRQESEMREALTRLAALRERAERAGACGNREYNTGWHTVLDLANMLPVSEAVTRSAIERRESRGAHFREDHPDKDAAFARVNIVVRRTRTGEMEVRRAPLPELTAELKQVIEENK